MIRGRKVVVVLPAYKAERTLEKTVRNVEPGCVDEFILVDDCSPDDTLRVARELGIYCVKHPSNQGYGGNQKTCYRLALERGADIVVMLHPDYQYEPRLVPAMAEMIASGVYDVVLGSRILGKGAIQGGMPRYKYISNRLLTLVENIFIGQKLSEYHTGFRAYSRDALLSVNWIGNSNDFVFDNEILVQFQWKGLRFGEISCPTCYSDESSSISFARSTKYGVGVLWTALKYVLQKWRIARFSMFEGSLAREVDGANRGECGV